MSASTTINTAEGHVMYSSPELVALIQHQRERALADERVARQLACVAASCSNAFGDRLARALRLAPTRC